MSFQEDMNVVSQSAGMPLKQLASERLKKMSTQKHESSPKGSKYSLPEAATGQGSSGERKQIDDSEMDMVYGSDEEEVQIRQPADFELGALDQDFEWIQEEIDLYMADIKSKDPVLSHVQKAFEKGKRKIPEELRDMTISEV